MSMLQFPEHPSSRAHGSICISLSPLVCLLCILGNYLKLFAPQILNMSLQVLNPSPFQMPSPLSFATWKLSFLSSWGSFLLLLFTKLYFLLHAASMMHSCGYAIFWNITLYITILSTACVCQIKLCLFFSLWVCVCVLWNCSNYLLLWFLYSWG